MRGHGIALVVLATVVAGCGSTSQAGATPRLGPPPAAPAAGSHRVTCGLDSRHGRVTLALDLPRGFVHDRARAGHCTWHLPVQVPGEDDGDPTTDDSYSSAVVVTVTSARRNESLQHTYVEVKPDAVEGSSAGGDDSVLHLRLRHDVRALGATHGDRLSYLYFCDGQNILSRLAQADGILLTWRADLPLLARTDRQLEAVLSSAGATRS